MCLASFFTSLIKNKNSNKKDSILKIIHDRALKKGKENKLKEHTKQL